MFHVKQKTPDNLSGVLKSRFYNISCWWKIEADFLPTLFSRIQIKKRLTFGKISRLKQYPTKGVSQWIIILENYLD